MKAWWQSLSRRDRSTLAIGTTLVALVLAWAYGYDPLVKSRDSLRTQVAGAEADVVWMRGARAELATQRNAGSATPFDRAGRSLLALADASAREAGLGGTLKRVEPVGEGRVNVWLEAAPFDPVTAWLEALAAQYGVTVDELSVDRTGGGPGLVNARVTLLDPPR